MTDSEPVDVATGDVLLGQDDVSLPVGPGVLPLIVSRAYRSSRRSGRWFGPSWASTFDQRLRVSPDGVAATFADGQDLSWRCEPGADGPVPVTGLPVAGPRRLLRRGPGHRFTVSDPQTALTWCFEGQRGDGRSACAAAELPLVSVADRAGHQVSFSYTRTGQPAWIGHSGGYLLRVLMQGGRLSGLAAASSGADNDVPLVDYRYDPAGNLAAVINSSGQALRFRYDEEGRLLGWEDRNGFSYEYSYDERGRCRSGAGPGGARSAQFTYGDRMTWRTDACDAVTTYQLDEAGQVAAVTDPLGHVSHYWHDEDGRELAHADPLGRLTRQDYDERGNLTCVTRPDGSQVRAVYDEAGLPVRLTEPGGASWQQEYDARGNLTQQTAPDGALTRYDYDEHGHPAVMTGPLGAVTRVESNLAGLPLAVTGPDGGITRYGRDTLGRVTAITGPGGDHTRLAWTTEGRLASRTFADGRTERLQYDAEGNLLTYLNPAGARTRYEYGPFNLVTAITWPGGSRVEFGYDQALRLTEVTYAGLTWRYGYDLAGQLVAVTDANGAGTEYSYDPAGQLTRRVNAVGQLVAYGYDELGNLTTREAGDVVTTFGYDAAGRLLCAQNPDAQLRLSRDPCGRVTAEVCNDRTVRSEYDRAGRRGRRVTPGGAQQRWEYDEAGRPVLLQASGHVLRFGYDRAGGEVRRELPGGLVLRQDWDGAGLLTSQVLAAPDGRVLARRACTYTADGLLTGIDDLSAGPRQYTLDRAGRITAVRGPGWAEQYTYDPAGRVGSARWVSPPPDVRGNWLAGDVQGPRERSGTLVTAAGAVRYAHDKQGRVVARQRARRPGEPCAAWTYQWDAEDRLTAVDTPDGSTWRYRYDPLGRRIAKQRLDSSGTLSQETIFTWDGPVLAEELTWRTARHGGASWDCVTWDYQPGSAAPLAQLERALSDGEPRTVTGTRFYAVVTDQFGTPAELVGDDGAVAGIRQQTVLGGTWWHPGGASTALRFPGQYYDGETGLHYHQQRCYDPVTGDYLTPDPPGITRGTYWSSGYPASLCRATARRDDIALRLPFAIGQRAAFVGGAQGTFTGPGNPAAGGAGGRPLYGGG